MVQRLLKELYDKVDQFIRLAVSSAQIVIVTLARSPWVKISSDNFMPKLKSLLDEFQHNNLINVVYARDYISEAMQKEYAEQEFKSNDEEEDFWMRVKAAAMAHVLESAHQRDGASWKNIISFGDSEYERLALIKTAETYILTESSGGSVLSQEPQCAEIVTAGGKYKKLRTKTVKMLESPSIEEMIAEVTLLTTWLPHIVVLDEGLSVEIGNSDDDAALNELNKKICGQDDDLSWEELGGMKEWAEALSVPSPHKESVRLH